MFVLEVLLFLEEFLSSTYFSFKQLYFCKSILVCCLSPNAKQ